MSVHEPLAEFFVAGVPAPQGSKRAFRNKFSGRIQQIENSTRVAPWRSDVRDAALAAMGDILPLAGAVEVALRFVFARPKTHLSASGTVKASAPEHMAAGPDVDKLARAVLDAMTSIVFEDDRQVVGLAAAKGYGDRPGVHVRVQRPT